MADMKNKMTQSGKPRQFSENAHGGSLWCQDKIALPESAVFLTPAPPLQYTLDTK